MRVLVGTIGAWAGVRSISAPDSGLRQKTHHPENSMNFQFQARARTSSFRGKGEVKTENSAFVITFGPDTKELSVSLRRNKNRPGTERSIFGNVTMKFQVQLSRRGFGGIHAPPAAVMQRLS